MENAFIFVENVLFEIATELPSPINDTCHILEIIDDISNYQLLIYTISFTYVNPTTCYPHKNINNVPHGISFPLCQICDIDEKFESCANEYK